MMITYKEITEAVPALKKIATVELGVRDAVKVAKLLKKVDGEMEIYRDLANKLCEKYGKLDEEKQCYHFEKEKMKEVTDAFKELDSIESENIGVIKIKLPEGVKVDAATIIGVEKFIEFDFEEE